MPEFLVITTRESIIDVAHHLKSEDGIEIKVEDDFTKGLKAIFYRLPDVVFIQEEIAGITAEKVAGQVRNLLDDEPIRMVLLREQAGEWDSVAAGFDGVIDAGIPFDDLLHRFREELIAIHAPVAEAYGSTGAAAESAEFITPLEEHQEIDPFSDMFPAQFHNDWSGISADAGQDAHEETVALRPAEESTIYGDEFCFETPGEIVSSLPPQSAEPLMNKPLPRTVSVPSEIMADGRGEEKSVRLTDRESPHQLYASMNGEEGELSDVIPPAGDNPAAPVSDRLRLRGVSTQRSLLKTDYTVEVPPNGVAGSSPKKNAAPTSAAPPGARTHREGPTLGESSAMTYRKRSPLRRLLPALLLVFIGLTTYLLLSNWDGLFRSAEKEEEPLNIPQPATPRAITTLPAFFPSVRPDPSYSALHPGWERYPGGGIDYLVYRENGVLKALQIIAAPEGKISDSFVRLCMRETTGQEKAINWTVRENNGFQVETGSLGNRGEVAVYRKMPAGEIRGVVLTFK